MSALALSLRELVGKESFHKLLSVRVKQQRQCGIVSPQLLGKCSFARTSPPRPELIRFHFCGSRYSISDTIEFAKAMRSLESAERIARSIDQSVCFRLQWIIRPLSDQQSLTLWLVGKVIGRLLFGFCETRCTKLVEWAWRMSNSIAASASALFCCCLPARSLFIPPAQSWPQEISLIKQPTIGLAAPYL